MVLLPFAFLVDYFNNIFLSILHRIIPCLDLWSSAELWKKCDVFADLILLGVHDKDTVVLIVIFCWSSVSCISSS